MKFLQLAPEDNVATLLSEASSGEEAGGLSFLDSIPVGHKVAIRDLSKGEFVVKYGENIGLASQDIRRGAHVHVHNMEGLRARGDKGGDNEA